MTDEEREQMEKDMNEIAGDDEIKAELWMNRKNETDTTICVKV